MPDDFQNQNASPFLNEETGPEEPAAAAPAADTSPKEAKAALRQKKKEEAAARAERKRAYKEYKRSKKILPRNRRPIICPPDGITPDSKKETFGKICRVFIILMAVFAMSLFVCDAFGFFGTENAPVSGGFLFLWSAVLTCLFSAFLFFRHRRTALWGGIVLALGITAVMLLPNPVLKPYESVIVAFNAARDHMAELGYYAINRNPVPVTVTTGTQASLIRTAVYLFVLLIAAVYTVCLVRRIRLWQLLTAGLLSAAIIFVIFEYNITRSNWGVTLLIASFAAALVMAAFDFIYLHKPKPDAADTDTPVIEQTDAPAVPALLQNRVNRQEAKEAKKAEKRAAAELKKKRKRGEVPQKTVGEDISDYFGSSAPKKEKKQKAPRLTAAEKKQKKAEEAAARRAAAEKKRTDRRELEEYRSYYRKKTDVGTAMGGFAGIGIFALAMLLLLIPALTADGPYRTVEAVDKKFEFYREYVTALLMGDDPALDLLAYENENGNFSPVSTDPRPIYYKGTPIFRVESNLRSSVYLRGWTATDYDDATGAWLTAEPGSETMDYYRSLFQTYIDPSEQMMYAFWRAMEEDSIPSPDERDYVKQSKSNTSLGFSVAQVNIRREELKTKLLFLPAYSLRSGMVTGSTPSGKSGVFLRGYGNDSSSGLSYADFFDGTYSSYRASLPNDGYAAVAMLPTMKNSGFYRNMAADIAEFNNAREAIAAGPAESVNEQGNIEYSLTLTDGSKYVYRLEQRPAAGEDAHYHQTSDASLVLANPDGFRYIVLKREIGDAVYRIDENNKVKARFTENIPEDKKLDEDGEEIFYPAPELPFVIRYFELMTDAERSEISGYMRILDYYTNFVYDTYTKKSSSTVVKNFAKEILDQATKRATEDYEEFDPETGETYLLTRYVDVHADYSGAEQSNSYEKVITNKKTGTYEFRLTDAVTDPAIYRLRHELVMTVIDYLVDEEHFTYTLTPAISSNTELIGVEKFLADTREGSCIQFATAAALVLRECGIPARFVTGYVAPELTVNYEKEKVASYAATVRDRNAHAWIEVFYDGVGWVQYECTPAYYGVMYEVSSSEGQQGHTIPGVDTGDETDDPGEDTPLTDEELAELERQLQEEARRARIRKIVTIALIAAVVIALIAVFFAYFLVRARKAQKERDDLVERIASAKPGTDAPSREEFRRLSELNNLMLQKCGLTPKAGEFRDEYAARLAMHNPGALKADTKEEKLTELERARTVMTTDRVRRMLDAVAAEEFGYGAAVEDMPLLARFFRRMYEFEYSKHVNPVTRVWLWLFARKL